MCTQFKTIKLEQLKQYDEDRIQNIINQIPSYLLKTEGVRDCPEFSKFIFDNLPKDCTHNQNHSFIVRGDDTDVGYINIIANYPHDNTAELALFAISEQYHGQGIGRIAYNLAEEYSRTNLRAKKISLCVDQINEEGSAFWAKNGYSKTGKTSYAHGPRLRTSIDYMEKHLA